MDPSVLKPHLVDIGGGRRMNLTCLGSGSPTLVFEQGGDGLITNWAKVQPEASKISRTCFYDRAGFGFSDPPDQPVTALSVTDDLHRLLKRGGVAGKIVLVGHSIGGFYATMYADRFPADVAGLVLLEPGFSNQGTHLSAERKLIELGYTRQGETTLVRCAALARAGKLEPSNLARNRCMVAPPDATTEMMPYILHAILRPYWYEAEHSQAVNFFSGDDQPSVSSQQEMDAGRAFGDMPLVVLIATGWSDKPWRTPEENRAAYAGMHEGQQRLASRSTNGRWELIPNSNHYVQKDAPEAVIKAIRDVVRAARREGSRSP
jgi:pimeloyl-ACP methyl ester carboxylesterase